jgi:pyruvate, water dikinase
MSKSIYNLAEATDSALVGGKAKALSKLIEAGFEIPEGFVLATTAQSFTPELQRKVLEWFDKLQTDFVAVRSSAIAEDGTTAAWAGQMDTFLNTLRDDLLKNIERCWQSSQSARAKSYAAQHSIESGAVAVIVQKMVQGTVSGVAFSAHPITKNDQQVVIEAGLGLGEAVVSGQITPDTYIVQKASQDLLEKHVSTQTKMLVKNAHGETNWQPLEDEGKLQKLSDANILALCNLVQKIESYFGHPVDVEWALYADKLYILQSRPITTLLV